MNVVVFGGHSPIAVAISKKLAASKVNVTHVSRNPQGYLRDSFSNNEVHLISINLEDVISAKKIWAKLVVSKKIDGVIFAQRFRGDLKNFHNMLTCDVITPFELVKDLCLIQNDTNKKILLFTSPASSKTIGSQDFPYHVTKAAILSMMKYLASGVMINVTANAVCPGSYVFKERARDFYEKNNQYFTEIQSHIPSHQFTQVEEIATLVEFLMIKAPNSINGQEIVVDGGLLTLDQSYLLDKFIPQDNKS